VDATRQERTGLRPTRATRSENSACSDVRGYVALRADGFTPNPKILDLGETRVAIFVGHIKFLRPHDKLGIRVRHRYPTDPPETPEPVIELNTTPGTVAV
jgi:hypothetical protein